MKMPTPGIPRLSLSAKPGSTLVLHLGPTCTIDGHALRPDTHSSDNHQASGRVLLSPLQALGPPTHLTTPYVRHTSNNPTRSRAGNALVPAARTSRPGS